ncbi:MAG: hypothetical protein M1376_20795 [Planctomycetes bacterium]|nr:hypothetical protein [Planctomycetota bacterium]
MLKTTRRILKANEVAFRDPLHLDLDPVVSTAGTEAPATTAGPSVRIAQNHPQYAIIEITCPCGKTTYLRCEYDTGKGKV